MLLAVSGDDGEASVGRDEGAPLLHVGHVPASPAGSLVTRFQAATVEVLLRLGVPVDIVGAERHEMEDARIGKAVSRQVLGSMTDFAYLMKGYREDPISLTEIALKLADAPCGPIDMRRPADVAMEVLGAHE